MGKPRMMPAAKMAAKVKQNVPVDSTGLDPEMAATLGGETARVMKEKAMYAPASMSKPKKAVAKPRKKLFGIF